MGRMGGQKCLKTPEVNFYSWKKYSKKICLKSLSLSCAGGAGRVEGGAVGVRAYSVPGDRIVR